MSQLICKKQGGGGINEGLDRPFVYFGVMETFNIMYWEKEMEFPEVQDREFYPAACPAIFFWSARKSAGQTTG